MQPETLISPDLLGRAAFNAAKERPDFIVASVLDWTDLTDDDRADWVAVARGPMIAAGLYALAEDVRAENDAVNSGVVEAGGAKYLSDPKGALIPLGMIKPQRLLEDEMVRKVMRFAMELSDQIKRFKGHTFADLAAFQSLLEQQYGVTSRGTKGNCSFSTFDDGMRVEVKIADLIAFGPELQAAKKLVDECLEEWGADSHEAIRALVNRVFSVGKEGQINRAELFSLLAMEVEDPRWQRGMEAIRDSIRVIGTKAYLRFRIRDEAGALATVTIDLAAA